MGSAIGSLAGAAVGSVVPGVGTALGASLGGTLGGAIGGNGGSSAQGTPATLKNTVQLPSWLNTPYQSQVSQAQTLSQQPYNPAFNSQIAGFNPQQQQAFGLTNSLVGQYQPYYNQALSQTGQLGNQAMGGLNNSQFQSYMNPYIQNVLDTSRDQAFQNYDMANQRLTSQAAGSGAFGNSRFGLTQGTLGSNFIRDLNAQQANTLAGGFNTALQGYQTGIGQGLNAANQLGSLATNQQNTGFAGINALYGMGANQQQLQQSQFNAAQQNALQEAQYPWQQMANAQSIMSTPAQIYGHQQTATQTLQQPSQLSQGLATGNAIGGMLGQTNFGALGSGLSSFFGGTGFGTGADVYNSINNPANTSFFREGGVVPGYKKGGKVDPASLTHGTRTGGLLHKGYADGGTIDEAFLNPTKLDTLGTDIAFQRSQNYVNQLLGQQDQYTPFGYAQGGMVGFAGGGLMDGSQLSPEYRAWQAQQGYSRPSWIPSLAELSGDFKRGLGMVGDMFTPSVDPGQTSAYQYPARVPMPQEATPIDALTNFAQNIPGHLQSGLTMANPMNAVAAATQWAQTPMAKTPAKDDTAETMAEIKARTLAERAALGSISKDDEKLLDSLHQAAGLETPKAAEEEGIPGLLGGRMNLDQLAMARGMMKGYEGHGNFAADLAAGGGGMLDQYEKQQQIEALNGYKNAMALAAQQNAGANVQRANNQTQMMPWQQALKTAQAQALYQKQDLQTQQLIEKYTNDVMMNNRGTLMDHGAARALVMESLGLNPMSGAAPSSLSGYTTEQLKAMRK